MCKKTELIVMYSDVVAYFQLSIRQLNCFLRCHT
uniref:Uncharacterized protein n=1 Tax=Anguilla anguilla TaxID=7936 RepID=A0A0E9U5X2_ANGAN